MAMALEDIRVIDWTIWQQGPIGTAMLGDLGAASFLPEDDPLRRAALQRIDRRALAVLLAELAHLCDDTATAQALRADAQRQRA